MYAKIAFSALKNTTDAQFTVDSNRILASMANNPAFPTPTPPLADVQTAHDAFVVAMNALDGGTNSTANRDQARADLVAVLRNLGHYVQATCNGDLVTLLSSGFSAQKGKQPPTGQLSPPQNVRMSRPNVSGQLRARCDAVANARMYQWRYASASAPTTWTTNEPSTTSRLSMTNLTVGETYIAQVRAFGTQGPTDWSDTASLSSL